MKRTRASVQERHRESSAIARVTVAGEHPSPRAAEASEPRSTAVTNARMASIRSIVADSVINHCWPR